MPVVPPVCQIRASASAGTGRASSSGAAPADSSASDTKGVPAASGMAMTASSPPSFPAPAASDVGVDHPVAEVDLGRNVDPGHREVGGPGVRRDEAVIRDRGEGDVGHGALPAGAQLTTTSNVPRPTTAPSPSASDVSQV